MLRTALIYHYPVIVNQFKPHFDWLLELKPQLNLDERTIMTWRVLNRIDLLIENQGDWAELIQPHRAYYLELNNTIFLSNSRGIVKPINKGYLTILKQNYKDIFLKINWYNSQQLLNINLQNNYIYCSENKNLSR